MNRPPNAFESVRQPAKPLPPEKQAKDHPRKRGKDFYFRGSRPPAKQEKKP